MAERPGAYMTRYEFLVALCKTLNIDEEEGPVIFKDTTKDQNKFLYPAFKQGIVVGFPDKRFGPNMLITENEALIMIARAKKQNEPPWGIFSDLLTQERCAELLNKNIKPNSS